MEQKVERCPACGDEIVGRKDVETQEEHFCDVCNACYLDCECYDD